MHIHTRLEREQASHRPHIFWLKFIQIPDTKRSCQICFTGRWIEDAKEAREPARCGGLEVEQYYHTEVEARRLQLTVAYI